MSAEERWFRVSVYLACGGAVWGAPWAVYDTSSDRPLFIYGVALAFAVLIHQNVVAEVARRRTVALLDPADEDEWR